jgi:F-type H+-transporting ATPase subunit alpha
MRAVSGRLRVDLAQYRELEAFAAFGSDLDRASQQQLARGARLVELLKQPAASPFPIGHEIVSIWTGTTGRLDDIEVADVRRFERELLEYVGHHDGTLFEDLAGAKSLDDDLVARLEKVVGEFKGQFASSSETAPSPSGSAASVTESAQSGADSSAADSGAADSGAVQSGPPAVPPSPTGGSEN